ncbi:hypothetical protein ACLESO_55570, partial [Pyxidicoccus sp. 3LG]
RFLSGPRVRKAGAAASAGSRVSRFFGGGAESSRATPAATARSAPEARASEVRPSEGGASAVVEPEGEAPPGGEATKPREGGVDSALEAARARSRRRMDR